MTYTIEGFNKNYPHSCTKEESKIVKKSIFLWNIPYFLREKPKTCQNFKKNDSKSHSGIIWVGIWWIKTYLTCNGALKWSSFQACYFFTPYFSIQMGKSAKCTLYLKAHKKFLGQQNFFIFSVFKSWKGVQYENPITFFAYFWLIFSTFQERGARVSQNCLIFKGVGVMSRWGLLLS